MTFQAFVQALSVKLGRAARRKNGARSRGFTLIEALAALAVVAMSLAAIGDLSNTTLRSGLHVERHLAAVQGLGALMTRPLGRDPQGQTTMSGDIGAQTWRIEAAPSGTDGGPGPWRIEKIRRTVLGPGARASVESLRLVKP